MKQSATTNQEDERTSIGKARKVSALLLIITLFFLFSYSKIFKPKPPVQNSLIHSLDEEVLKKGIIWYAENSVGSLSLPEQNTCTVTQDSISPSCTLFKSSYSPEEIYKRLDSYTKNETLWSHLWSIQNTTSKPGITFSLYKVTPLKIHAIKKVPYPLGDLIETLPSFERTSLSPFVSELLSKEEEIIDPNAIKKLNENLSTQFQHVIFLKKHPMGYYLEIPPLR